LSLNPWLLLAALPLAFLAVVFGYPLYTVVQESFTEPTAGLANYDRFFSEDLYLNVLRRTVTTSFAVTIICVLLGYPYAYAMTRVSAGWRAALLFIVLVPLWTSLLVRTYAWTVLLQDTGVINNALIGLGIIDEPIQLIRTQLGVVLGMSQVLLPFMVLPLYATLRTIDPSYMRASSSLGAGPFTSFRKVYFPMSLPGVAAGSLIVFVWALGFYITPALLGGPGQAQLSQIIVLQISQLLNMGFGSAIATILLVLTLLVIGLLSRLVRIDKVYNYQ
jgi:putative spermidine/putrescine transport system permease protein